MNALMETIFSADTSPLSSRHGFNPISLARLQQVNRQFNTLFSQDTFWRPYLPDSVIDAGVRRDTSCRILRRKERTEKPKKFPYLSHFLPSGRQRRASTSPLTSKDTSFDAALAAPISAKPSARQAYRTAVLHLDDRALNEMLHLYHGRAPTEWGAHLVSFFDGYRAVKSYPDQWLVVQAALERYGIMLRHASPKLRASARLAWLAVHQDPEAYKYVMGPQRLNPALVAAAVGRLPELMSCLPVQLCNDKNLLTFIVGKQPQLLEQLCDGLLADFSVVAAAVKEGGSVLRYATPAAKDDLYLASLAVNQDGNALEFVSDRLKKDFGLVWAAVQQDALALRHAHPSLRDMGQIARSAVRLRPEAMAFVGPKQQADKGLALIAAAHPLVHLHMLPPHWLADAEVVALTLPRCQSELWLAPIQVRQALLRRS